jgi:ribosomal protein S6
VGQQEFARVANRKNPDGYYLEVTFEGDPAATGDLKKRLLKLKDVFRVFFTKPA